MLHQLGASEDDDMKTEQVTITLDREAVGELIWAIATQISKYGNERRKWEIAGDDKSMQVFLNQTAKLKNISRSLSAALNNNNRS